MEFDQGFDLEKEFKKCKTIDELTGKNGLFKKLLKQMIEGALEEEMKDHLGYAKSSPEGHLSGNSRNGHNSKTVKSISGELELQVPRDRASSFEPQLVKKRQVDIREFDDKIISMYAKGMTTRDIQDHVEDIYGVNMSASGISNIVQKVHQIALEWQNRELAKVYAVVYFDAIHYKVRDNGKVVSKAAYVALGIDLEGKKDILGIWIGEAEGAKFWLRVISELKNRNVKDILIACVDGLKGLPEAIGSVYPKTDVQLCVVHMIRNSVRYIPHKHSKEFLTDLKSVYTAITEEQGRAHLAEIEKIWGEKYPLSLQSWTKNWDRVSTLFCYPEAIRKMIYTTNCVESLNRQFRKVTKNRSIFPNDEALHRMLFLAARDISKKWTMPRWNWKEIISHLSVHYEERVTENLGM